MIDNLDERRAARARRNQTGDAAAAEQERGKSMTKELKKYHERYEKIMTMEPGRERDRRLAELMTELEREYRIPALRNPEWEAKNRVVIALYRKVAKSRTTI